MTKKIYGFMHICMANQWKSIVDEQLSKLKSSGLYDKTTKIYCAVLGNGSDSFIINDKKFEIVYRDNGIKKYEFPILEYMHKFSKNKKELYFYIHTKSVFHETTDNWRKAMEYFIIEKHNDCIKELEKVDIVGCFWCGGKNSHFSGNFWWAKSEHISQLPIFSQEDKINRFNAEFWIGRKNNILISSICQKHKHSEPNEYEGLEISPIYYDK